jgi:hypothetical protein
MRMTTTPTVSEPADRHAPHPRAASRHGDLVAAALEDNLAVVHVGVARINARSPAPPLPVLGRIDFIQKSRNTRLLYQNRARRRLRRRPAALYGSQPSYRAMLTAKATKAPPTWLSSATRRRWRNGSTASPRSTAELSASVFACTAKDEAPRPPDLWVPTTLLGSAKIGRLFLWRASSGNPAATIRISILREDFV